jgi:hypothetical protein
MELIQEMPQDNRLTNFLPMAMDRINSITNLTEHQIINIKMMEISRINNNSNSNSNNSNIGQNMLTKSSNQLTKTASLFNHKKKSKISLTLFLASNMRKENKLREVKNWDLVKRIKIKIRVPFV